MVDDKNPIAAFIDVAAFIDDGFVDDVVSSGGGGFVGIIAVAAIVLSVVIDIISVCVCVKVCLLWSNPSKLHFDSK